MIRLSNITIQARNLLQFTVLQYMLDSFYDNPSLGKCYVDMEQSPSICILVFNHQIFLGGTPTDACMAFLQKDILTGSYRTRHPVCYFIYAADVWKTTLTERFSEHAAQYGRSLFKARRDLVHEARISPDIHEITPELMTSSLGHLGMILDEILSTGTYGGMDDFLTRGIGFAPVFEHTVCGFCTSEYPSKTAIAIGIEVTEAHQRKGLATAMTDAFLQRAASQGLDVYWECWKNNEASVNTALRCGFEKVGDYPIVLLKLAVLPTK